MKKLLALCVVGGLLATITGCPSPNTGPTGKGVTGSTEMKERGGKINKKMKREESSEPGAGAKKEEKKEETKPDGGVKKEEKKEETKPDGGTKKEEKKEEKK